MMDRIKGKTQDCFVEFFSKADVEAWVNWFRHRHPAFWRVEERSLDARCSSQDDLLKQLLPRAKNVEFQDRQPKILPSEDPYNTGFKTFVSTEELDLLVKHADMHTRYPLLASHTHVMEPN